MKTLLPIVSALESPIPLYKKLPKDIMALTLLVGGLWVTTIVWYFFDFKLELPIRSESDAWFLAISGLIGIYFAVEAIVASWGVILGIPTCLLFANLGLCRLQPKSRWLIAATVTGAIFIGIPIALNRHEQGRVATLYQRYDAGSAPKTVGRAIELRSDAPARSTWQLPLSCDGHCLELLTFGRAKTVTLSFPSRENAPGAGPFFQTYRLGARGADCAGNSFEQLCAHLASDALPDDRLVLNIHSVEPPSPNAAVLARRLYVKDTRSPGGPPGMLTRFVVAPYPGLLNIAFRDRGFSLPRIGLPILVEDKLDSELYRDVISNKSLNGKYYPFR